MSSLIQVWTPLFPTSQFDETFARDLHRAEQEWGRGIDRIWLVPEATENSFWRRPLNGFLFGEGIIPAERPNAISIFHIDEDHRLYPPMLLPTEWGGMLPDELYLQWLNINPSPMPPQETVPMFAPRAQGGRIKYGFAPLTVTPGPMLSASAEEKDGQRAIDLGWPPKQATVNPVSPETESAQLYGQLNRDVMMVDGKEIGIVRSEKLPDEKGVYFWLRWPEPFNLFFPYSCGEDVLFHHGTFMRRCISAWQDGQYRQALHDAELWVNRFSCEVQAPLEWAWLMPKLILNENDALFAVKAKYVIDVGSVQELVASNDYVKIRQSSIKVRRVYGWLGFFWWQLYQDMLTEDFVGVCEHCGKIIRGGHKDRKYCTEEENPLCLRDLARLRQRRRRNKLKNQ